MVTGIDKMTNDQLESYYSKLTDAMRSFGDHERNVWRELNERRDPDFARTEEIAKAETTLNNLRAERSRVMRRMKNQFNNSTRTTSAALKLDHSSKYISDLHANIIGAIDADLAQANTQVMTLRRSIVNNKKIRQSLRSLSLYAKITTGALVVCIALCVVSWYFPLWFPAKNVLLYTLLLVLVAYVTVLAWIWWSRKNLHEISVHERVFRRPRSTMAEEEIMAMQPQCPGTTDGLINFTKDTVNDAVTTVLFSDMFPGSS